MFDLFIKFSSYLFVLYIVLFLYNGIALALDYAGLTKQSHIHGVFTGRTLIVLMHITAFLILSYNRETFAYNKEILIIGALGLAFIMVVNYLANLIYKDSCPLIWNCVFFLLDVGIIMLQRLNPALAFKQLIWIMLGFFIAMWIPVVLKLIPRFEAFEMLYIVLSFVLILSTLVLGRKEYGSTNWIYIGSFSFQPSEIVKFLFVFYLASVLRKKIDIKELMITGGLSAGIVVLLVFQKDLGSALIFFLTYMTMLYIATSNEILFVGGVGAASIASVVAYKLFNHVRVRVAAWKNPWADVDSGGYQIVQSLFAIGTGGFLGSGLTKGMPLSIPVVSKDFIFAAVCEEFGTIFGICIVGIFILLFARGFAIAFNSKRRYYSLIAAGFTAMMAFQTFLIIGGVIKLIPLTGVTLPFVSYGGSSVVVSILTIGILQWLCGWQHTLDKEEGADNE
ncbi:MAG: FtsW/RodA/SpoVE family cell cycle protein [Anaerotignaceae bacterium]